MQYATGTVDLDERPIDEMRVRSESFEWILFKRKVCTGEVLKQTASERAAISELKLLISRRLPRYAESCPLFQRY